MVLSILYLLLPKNILTTILSKHDPSDAYVSYLRAFHKEIPKDLELNLALIEHETIAGHLTRAERELNALKIKYKHPSSILKTQLYWLDYLKVRYKAQKVKHNTSKRILYLQKLRLMAKTLSNLPLQTEQLKTLANDSIGLGQPERGLQIYKLLFQQHRLKTADEFAKGANIALQNNSLQTAFEFYEAAYNNAKTLKQKRKFARKMLEALWADNKLQKALRIALNLPKNITQTRTMSLFISQLSLAANNVKLAEKYLLLTLGLSTPDNKDFEWYQQLKTINFDNKTFLTLYRIFLYQAKIAEAAAVAKIAVENRPNSITWRIKLAKTSIWNGEYIQGLNAWLFIVNHTKNPKLIKEAIDVAGKLSYDSVVVELLETYLKYYPDEKSTLLSLAFYKNRIGYPNEALSILQNLNKTHPSREVDELMASIYQDLTQWNEAEKMWRHMDNTYGLSIKSLMAQASIYYNRGELQRAIDILEKAIPLAQKSDKEYWDTLGDLAWSTNNRKDAILSFSQDLNNSSNVINLTEILKIQDKKLALKYSLYGWYKFHKFIFLNNALFFLAETNQILSPSSALWEPSPARGEGNTTSNLKQLLFSLKPKDRKRIETKQIYWQSLVRLYNAYNMPIASLIALQRGIAVNPDFYQLKGDLSWTIMRGGDLSKVKKIMLIWYEQKLLHTPIIWQTFAEGYGMFNRFDYGISIYQANLSKEPDNYPAIIDYANMLEKDLRYKDAYAVKKNLWKKIHKRYYKNPELDILTIQSLSQLAPTFTSIADVISYMNRMLLEYPNDQSVTILVNWLMSNNFYNIVTIFANNYLTKPLINRIAIFLALQNHDLQTLQNITTNQQTLWPRADSINAAMSLQNTALAENLAFEELTERPKASEVYEGFTQIALADSNFIRATTEDQLFINVFGPRFNLESKYRLTNELSFEPYIKTWSLHSSDKSTITNVPSVDLETGAFLNQKIWRGNIKYHAGYRQVVGSFPTADIELNYKLAARWSLNLNTGINQLVSQTSYLLVGGMQDKIDANVIYSYAKYDSLHFDIQGQNYYSQNRHYLANGYFAQALYKHKFWLSYPDFTINLFANIWDFNHNGTYGGDITSLFPSLSQQQQADPNLVALTRQANFNLILPPTYKQMGFIFDFGNAIIDYSHAWRPYCWLTYYYNTFVGFAYTARLGINGSIFGRDALTLYAERGIAPAAKNSVTQKAGLRYSLFY